MELLFVSTTASARAAAPLSFGPLRRAGSPSVVAPLRRRLPSRGCRAASAAVPDPVPSEEPASSASASSTVAVTEKPASPPPAEEKAAEEESPASSASVADESDSPAAEKVGSASSASVDATVAAPASSEDGGLDVGDILSKLDIEVTPTLILTGSGAFVTLWVMLSVVSAIDSIPLLPKLLELVGIGYSAWFVYRYLLFKGSRDELFAKFEDLKQRII